MALLIMGGVLMVIGVILFFVQNHQKAKAFSLRIAKPATTAELEQMSSAIAQEIGGGSWREYVKVTGTIECDRPLISELKQEPCVYYTMTVTREYEEQVTRTDDKGNTRQETQRGSETVASNKQSVPFMLHDQAGIIEVNPTDANIETVKVLDEFRQNQPAGGLLSFGNFSLALGNQFMGGGRRTIGYRYCESILPLHRTVCVVATVSDSPGHLVLQKPDQSAHKFIISLRTHDELLKATDRNARNAFYGMVACLGVGLILILVGLVAGVS